MADPIAIVKGITKLAVHINKIVKEVKSFPDLAEKLDFKIQMMTDSLDFLSNMSSQKVQLLQYCKDEPHLHLFARSLTKIFECIKDVNAFIDEIKGMSNFDKVRKMDSVNKKYSDLEWKLDELQKSIQFSLLTEVKADVNRGADPVQTLVKHARQSGAFSSTTGSPVDRQPKAKQPDGADRLQVLKKEDFGLITPRLGEGGFGEVWKADYHNGGQVAVKIFDNARNRHMVLKEACKMQRAINSPHIVRLVGIIDEPDCQAIVMDYFENGSLKSFMKYMNCDCMARRMRMLCDISIGMNYLHSTLNPPIIHKDIKACNIFIDHGLMAKIGDLGLSSSTTTSFDTGVTVGTVSHLPPESWSGQEMKAKKPWDIYEFGITVYEITSGEDPWPSYANPAHIRGWVYADNKRPDDINTDARKVIDEKTPKEITILMRECWDTSPERRPTSQDIQKRLTSAYGKKYNSRDLRNADLAIYQQMDQTNDKPSTQSSADSGISNSAGRLQDLGIGDQEQGAASRDSGFGATAAYHATSTQDKPGVTMGASSQQWRVIKQFGKKGNAQGEFNLAYSIAVCDNGDIVICDIRHSRVYVFNKYGEYKHTVGSPVGNPDGKLVRPCGVGITNGQVVIADREDKYIKVYDVHGTYTSRFPVLSTTESSNTKVSPCSITVSSSDGTVLVGDAIRQVVTIHGYDGKLKQTVRLDIEPAYLSTNGLHHIIGCDGNKVQCVDYAGKVIFVLNSFTVDDKPGKPSGVTCDDDDTLYVAVMQCGKYGEGIDNTGHIHQYSPSGKFVQCIMKGLYFPMGITWHNGRIYIANQTSVVILGKS